MVLFCPFFFWRCYCSNVIYLYWHHSEHIILCARVYLTMNASKQRMSARTAYWTNLRTRASALLKLSWVVPWTVTAMDTTCSFLNYCASHFACVMHFNCSSITLSLYFVCTFRSSTVFNWNHWHTFFCAVCCARVEYLPENMASLEGT